MQNAAYLIYERRYNSQFWKPLRKPLNTLWACDQVQEQYPILWHTSGLENIHGHRRRASCNAVSFITPTMPRTKPTGSKHRVKQQHPSIRNVFWKLIIE